MKRIQSIKMGNKNMILKNRSFVHTQIKNEMILFEVFLSRLLFFKAV